MRRPLYRPIIIAWIFIVAFSNAGCDPGDNDPPPDDGSSIEGEGEPARRNWEGYPICPNADIETENKRDLLAGINAEFDDTNARRIEYACGCFDSIQRYWDARKDIYATYMSCFDTDRECSDWDSSERVGETFTILTKNFDYTYHYSAHGPAGNSPFFDPVYEFIPGCRHDADDWDNMYIPTQSCNVTVEKFIRVANIDAEILRFTIDSCLLENQLPLFEAYSKTVSNGDVDFWNGDGTNVIFGIPDPQNQDSGAYGTAFNDLPDPWPGLTRCVERAIQDIYDSYAQPDRDDDRICDHIDSCRDVANTRENLEENGADGDGDGWGRSCDKCPDHFSNDQGDQDRDGIGNACDLCVADVPEARSDTDGDRVNDLCDNCPLDPNPYPAGSLQQLDRDDDGVGDDCDDCPTTPNPEQDGLDFDSDGIPDDCDNCMDTPDIDQTDSDNDGLGNRCDNCRNVPNPDQNNADNDTEGDACDDCPELSAIYADDRDEDCVEDEKDNCPDKPNTDQTDSDGDGRGDACIDSDGDGIKDDRDNCRDVPNEDQRDGNGDGQGDACTDTDGDGVFDPDDNCRRIQNHDQHDSDGNGRGDACQDSDGDGVYDDQDNCRDTPNRDQGDRDGDGYGDACDACPDYDSSLDENDLDRDCIENQADNCPNLANGMQEDIDRDGKGDVCDNCPGAENPDQGNMDADPLGNACDNCPHFPNPDQADPNGDGVGLACEVLSVAISPEASRYVDLDRLSARTQLFRASVAVLAGAGAIREMNYSFSSDLPAHWALAQYRRPVPRNGIIEWDGQYVDAATHNWQFISWPGRYTLRVEARTDAGVYVVEHPFTVYQMRIVDAANPNAYAPNLPNLNFYVNNDDDDGNGISDLEDPAAGAEENDLKGVRMQMRPLLPGRIEVRSDESLALWADPGKQERLDLAEFDSAQNPIRPIYIEGLSGARFDLTVRWVLEDGHELIKALPVNLIQVDIVKDSDPLRYSCQGENLSPACFADEEFDPDEVFINRESEAASSLNIARWEDAYLQEGIMEPQISVFNEINPFRNFIDRDPERFYIRVINHALNVRPDLREVVREDLGALSPKLGVMDAQGREVDNLTPQRLVETSANSGVFVSSSHMLTTLHMSWIYGGDFPAEDLALCGTTKRCSDDLFKAHDGFVRPVGDDVWGDRTHQAHMNSQATLEVQGSNALPPFRKAVPVCERDARLSLKLKIYVYQDPFLDTGVLQEVDGVPVTMGANDGRFTFNDLNQNGICECIDGSDDCLPALAECEPFFDIGPDGHVPDQPTRVGRRGPVVSRSRIERAVAMALRSWQQACIDIHVTALEVLENPVGVLGDLFVYDVPDVSIETLNQIIEQRGMPADEDVLEVLVVPGGIINPEAAQADEEGGEIVRAAPYSSREEVVQAVRGGVPVLFLGSVLNEGSNDLAHELGHILGNDPVLADGVDFNSKYFYPSEIIGSARFITQNRRLSQNTITQSRIRRPVDQFEEPGNALLVPFDPFLNGIQREQEGGADSPAACLDLGNEACDY